MAVEVVSGNSGRVIVGGTTVATAKSWKLTKTTTAIAIPNFESPTQGSLVYPEQIAGLSGATISMEGQFDIGTDVTDTIFSNGSEVILDLIMFKGTPFGYDSITALCTSFAPSVNIENQATGFTAEFVASGVVPLSSVVT